MPVYFLDTSALVKRYVSEPGSERLLSLLSDGPPSEVYVSRIAEVELASAIARRGRDGDVSLADARKIRSAFKTDLEEWYTSLEITDEVLDHAVTLATRHVLRAYDAVQLASAMLVHRLGTKLHLSEFYLVSADEELNRAAASEGMKVINPQHSQ